MSSCVNGASLMDRSSKCEGSGRIDFENIELETIENWSRLLNKNDQEGVEVTQQSIVLKPVYLNSTSKRETLLYHHILDSSVSNFISLKDQLIKGGIRANQELKVNGVLSGQLNFKKSLNNQSAKAKVYCKSLGVRNIVLKIRS